MEIKNTEVLGENQWLQLIEAEYSDGSKYTLVHETRCNGAIVGVLPFRRGESGNVELLVRNEFTPCWNFGLNPSSVTGGVDTGDTVLKTAAKETREETGYFVTEKDMIPLGTCYGMKCADTVYHLYAVDVTGKAEIPIESDGNESKAQNYWIDYLNGDEITKIVDPIWAITYMRLLTKNIING